MDSEKFSILLVNTTDLGGGAEKVAGKLLQQYISLGLKAWMVVGWRKTTEPHILEFPTETSRGVWATAWNMFQRALDGVMGKDRFQGFRRRFSWLRGFTPAVETLRGHEDFEWPASWHVLDVPPQRPDIVHCHNLHGGYFDLRVLPWLSHQVPVILTLHDAWLLAGHCAHSLSCDRWVTGCGSCPNLSIYPGLLHDGTEFNWRRKLEIYKKSRLYVATPSEWLMNRVRRSILSAAIEDSRVIPNGVDLSVFRPSDREEVRSVLGLPTDRDILLFAANGITANPWKDYRMLLRSLRLVSHTRHGKVLFVALGQAGRKKRVGNVEITFVPFVRDEGMVAKYYQAADLYVHAAKVETFPLAVLESMACGTPVVATSVGGIPEIIEDEHSGLLISPGDAASMANRIVDLLDDEGLRSEMGRAAVARVRERYDLKDQVKAYLSWYRSILDARGAECQQEEEVGARLVSEAG